MSEFFDSQTLVELVGEFEGMSEHSPSSSLESDDTENLSSVLTVAVDKGFTCVGGHSSSESVSLRVEVTGIVSCFLDRMASYLLPNIMLIGCSVLRFLRTVGSSWGSSMMDTGLLGAGAAILSVILLILSSGVVILFSCHCPGE